MSETEKITINLGVVDLGKIDLLVEQGFYTNRTDFIRTSIRNQINSHNAEIEGTVKRKSLVVGILVYSASDLEKRKEKGEMLDIYMVGMLVLTDDVSPQLARETINSLQVFGNFTASRQVKRALADRIQGR